jgi:cobalt-zinc-cadmium efflux system protein
MAMDAHGHHHDHASEALEVEESGGKLLASILITSATLIAEVVGGILTGSLALLSDAAHVFLDIFALGLGYIAVRMSKRAATGKHSFGFYRMKVLAAFINGATLLVVSFEIIREAIGRFAHPQPIIAGPMLIVAIIGLVANLIVAFVLKGHSHDDLNARAAFLHVLGDALSSVGVIAAGVIILFTGWFWLDPLAGILIALVILRGAFSVLKEATHILNEGSPENADSAEVAREIAEIEGVKGVHDAHVWALEPGYRVLSAHVVLDDQPLSATTEIMDRIKDMLHDHFEIKHTTIQFECGDCGQCGSAIRA